MVADQYGHDATTKALAMHAIIDIPSSGSTRRPAAGRWNGAEPDCSLIRLGRVASGQQADLANRALANLPRFWPGLTQAYHVHGRGQSTRDLPRLATCNRVGTDAFSPLLNSYLDAGRLYVPTASEASPELALFALAGGVPLDAISLDRLSPRDGALDLPCPTHGDVFLKVPLRHS